MDKEIKLGKHQITKIFGSEKCKVLALFNRYDFITKTFNPENIEFNINLLGFKINLFKEYKSQFKKNYAQRFTDKSQEYLESIVCQQFEQHHHKQLNLDKPTTFSEKLNWLKVFYHNPVTTICADKSKVKDYITEKIEIAASHFIPQYGIYASAEEINFSVLPKKFALKSNWGSGQQILVKDKSTLNIAAIKKEMHYWLLPEGNHYYCAFEFGYKDMVPKIVCEELIDFEYKLEFFCFNGVPRYYWTIFDDKTKAVHADFYTIDGEKIPLRHKYPNTDKVLPQPADFNEMKEIAEKLSADFPFVRIDFYKTKTSWYFSEMTFCHWAGLMPMTPEKYDYEFGEYLQLPPKMI